MKKLITLLTLLLSFSFADAMSLRIELLNNNVIKNKALIILTYTIEDSLYETSAFKLDYETLDQFVPISETNKKEFEKLNLIISDKLKLKSNTQWANRKIVFNPKASYYSSQFEQIFLNLLIGNDWMITEHNNDRNGRAYIYAYKQTK